MLRALRTARSHPHIGRRPPRWKPGASTQPRVDTAYASTCKRPPNKAPRQALNPAIAWFTVLQGPGGPELHRQRPQTPLSARLCGIYNFSRKRPRPGRQRPRAAPRLRVQAPPRAAQLPREVPKRPAGGRSGWIAPSRKHKSTAGRSRVLFEQQARIPLRDVPTKRLAAK